MTGVEIVVRLTTKLPDQLIPYPRLKQGQISKYIEKHHWILIPNSVGYTKEGIEYRINSLGMRCPDFKVDKNSNDLRLMFMGDSTIFGWRVAMQDNLPEQVAAILRNQIYNTKIETVNCGVIGYSTLQGRLEMQRWLSSNPNIIFISYGWNDSTPRGLGSKSDLEYHIESQTIKYKLTRFLNRSAFLSYCQKIKKSHSDTKRRLLEQLGTEKANDNSMPRVNRFEYSENLEWMIHQATSQKIGIVFIPISVPPKYLIEMTSLALKYNIPLLHLDDALRAASSSRIQRKHYYFDECHPTVLGYKIMAENLHSEIGKYIHLAQ